MNNKKDLLIEKNLKPPYIPPSDKLITDEEIK